MRALLIVALVLLLPGTAHAGKVGLEGTEIVYRSAPGQEDLFEAQEAAGVLTFQSREGGALRVTPGAGCARASGRVRCPLAGVTAVRILAGDSDDLPVATVATVPLVVDLGTGDDDFDGRAPTLTVSAGEGTDRVGYEGLGGALDMGPGEDSVEIELAERFVGPLTVEGGEGRDLMAVYGTSKPGISLSGGAGDDEILIQTAPRGPGIDIACGPGDDAVQLRLADRPGDGCAPHVAVGAPQAVSRVFRSATLGAPASGTVEFHRDPGPGRRGAVLLARGAFDAPAGPLRVRLNTTRAGRRWIGRNDRLKLFVTVTIRHGGDHSEVEFASRLAP